MITQKEALYFFEKHLHKKAKSITKAVGGVSSVVYKLYDSENKNYYFKQGENNYKIQWQLTEKLTAMGVKIPPIIAFSDSWLITEGVNGTPLDLRRLINTEAVIELGRQAALIHQCKTAQFGYLITPTMGKYISYLDYYRKTIPVIKKELLPPVYDYLSKNHQAFLNHGDLFFEHVYVDKKGKFKSLIDWDDVTSAPRRFDLSEFLLDIKNNQQIWSLFMKGYSEHCEYVEIDDKDLLIESLLQACKNYQWNLKNLGTDIKRISTKKESIGNIEKALAKYI
jgi:hypothetical protein